jgi:hypothetical protein
VNVRVLPFLVVPQEDFVTATVPLVKLTSAHSKAHTFERRIPPTQAFAIAVA